MRKTSPPLSLVDFGKQLLHTRDLDPVYVLLWHVNLPQPRLFKWLLAYWCFYDVGTASYILDTSCHNDSGTPGENSDINDTFWTAMEDAASSKSYPRGSERRHFRGRNAVQSVSYLKRRGIDSLFSPLVGRALTVYEVITEVKLWRGFGDWIAFKIADMLERLDVAKVEFGDFDYVLPLIHSSPLKGAELARNMYFPNTAVVPTTLSDIIHELLSEILEEKAPPRYEREINIQEIETILCKWYSHHKGHYKIGEDTHKCRKSLLKFSRYETSQELLQAGKVGKLW